MTQIVNYSFISWVNGNSIFSQPHDGTSNQTSTPSYAEVQAQKRMTGPYHYKTATRFKGEELKRSFAPTLKWPDAFVLPGVLDSMITLQVEKIRQHRVQYSASLCTMEDKHLLAIFNLEQALE
jgi:hypothetical protein